jgi:diguanylate cyclase (GGDEF)-like protein/PAS domain S-box-containing protein
MTQSTPKILAIDDTPANLMTLGSALGKEFDLQIATSGAMGIALAQKNPPDLVLLDIMMPEMDGFDVCQGLKEIPALKNIPVIFVTSLSEMDAQAKGLALGAVDYITKPINVEIARQRIRNHLSREQLRREVEVQRDLLDAQLLELEKTQKRLQLAASVFTYAREAIMITAANGTVVDVNEAFCLITGYSREEILDQNPRMMSSGTHPTEFYADMWRDLSGKGHWYGEIWNRRKNGEVFAAMQTISSVRNEAGEIDHFVSLFSDITESKTHQKELEIIAHYDALTTLPNRTLLADRLRHALYQSQRRGQMLAVVFLDLDGFKRINDQYGHVVGDQLLIGVAKRMRDALREGDTLSRIGGDEFVAVLVDLVDVSACVPLLTRLLAAASEPISAGDLVLRVSASLGVTFAKSAEDTDADLLLRQADQAMYQAKLAGKNRYHVFDAELDRSVRGHHESLDRIRQALEEGQFVLYYQPKVNMRTGCVIGTEALIRWNHPERGLLLPALFLPVIEDSPLAIDVGEWVLETAIVQLQSWQALGLQLPVSVNIGARQLQQAAFVEKLRGVLQRHPDVDPKLVELEILETSALEDMAGVSAVIETCRGLGVMFSLDDFGTGYSSLTYLKRLPVAQIKIDQSFVRDLLDDPDNLAILEGVIGLAAAFKRVVIAEGVETVEHGSMLLQLGCDRAQGYGIARPMPAGDFPDWAKAWVPDHDWSALPVVSRDCLPLLFAYVEYRAWFDRLANYLHDRSQDPLRFSRYPSKFMSWLDTTETGRYGQSALSSEVAALHREAMSFTEKLLSAEPDSAQLSVPKQLQDLHRLRDAILRKLRQLATELPWFPRSSATGAGAVAPKHANVA